MSEPLTAADFSPLVGEVLPSRVPTADGIVEVPLTIVDVTEGAPYAPELPTPFSVSLTGPANAVLPQGTFEFVHPTRGSIELFLVPNFAGPAGAEYTIAFS